MCKWWHDIPYLAFLFVQSQPWPSLMCHFPGFSESHRWPAAIAVTRSSGEEVADFALDQDGRQAAVYHVAGAVSVPCPGVLRTVAGLSRLNFLMMISLLLDHNFGPEGV
jgi:hypothetical protein